MEMHSKHNQIQINAVGVLIIQFRLSISHSETLVNVEWESRAIFLTIYDDLYKTYLWGTCITLNLFVALTAASESIYDVINMAAI